MKAEIIRQLYTVMLFVAVGGRLAAAAAAYTQFMRKSETQGKNSVRA